MKMTIDVVEDGEVLKMAESEVSENDTLEAVVSRLAKELEIESEEIFSDFDVDGKKFDRNMRFIDCKGISDHLTHQRVCIEIHFETEVETHRFSTSETWGKVHDWACNNKTFNIPKNLCANLELREGSPTGEPLNDQKRIGPVIGCKVVWLVNPGSEKYGCL